MLHFPNLPRRRQNHEHSYSIYPFNFTVSEKQMHPIIVFPSHDTKNYLKKCNNAVLFQLMIQLQNKEGISLTAVHQ